MTVVEALQWANEKLKAEHIDVIKQAEDRLDSPMLDAQILLAHALEVAKSWLFTHFDYQLPEHKQKLFKKLIKRRAAHEPIAYITEEKEFYKRSFNLNHSVLIPRPATETLIDEAIAVAKEGNRERTIFADIGTGSGIIAATLAAETKIPGIATDLDEQALKIAKENIKKHQVAELIDLRVGNLFEPVAEVFKSIKAKRASLYSNLVICANLPYLSEDQWEATQLEIKEYEPKSALVAEAAGLECYQQLFRQIRFARNDLPFRVTVIVEIDPSQAGSIFDLIRHDFPSAKPTVVKDLEGLNRVVIVDL